MTVRFIAPDSAEWRDRLDAGAGDVYHQPVYLAACAGADDAVIAVAESADASLAVPLVLRRLPDQLDADGWRDAESPYGYASPISVGAAAPLWDELAQALPSQRIVNAFLRFHPLDPCEFPVGRQVGADHSTAWIPLADGRAAAFAGGACDTHRQKARRALKLGFTARVERPVTAASLTAFRALYDQTMARLDAERGYYFDDDYYRRLLELGERMALVTIVDAQGAIGYASLFLAGPRWLHYHLTGRSADCPNPAGHLLFEAAADWAAQAGLQGVHLGGGLTDDPEDPLLVYKRHVGRGRASYRVAGLVGDAARHQSLIDAWARGGGAPRWFQAYRQPLAASTA